MMNFTHLVVAMSSLGVASSSLAVSSMVRPKEVDSPPFTKVISWMKKSGKKCGQSDLKIHTNGRIVPKALPGDVNHQLYQLVSDELRGGGVVLEKKQL